MPLLYCKSEIFNDSHIKDTDKFEPIINLERTDVISKEGTTKLVLQNFASYTTLGFPNQEMRDQAFNHLFRLIKYDIAPRWTELIITKDGLEIRSV